MKNPRLTVFPVAVAIVASVMAPASSSPAIQRSSRSIWPFAGSSASSAEETAAVPEAEVSYDSAIAQGILKVGPNDRRIWKIHKYQGIDVRPIDMVPGQDTGVELPQPANSDAGYPIEAAISGPSGSGHRIAGDGFGSSVDDSPAGPSVPQPVNYETTTGEVDLSFLDDLGGLAWFLPEPKDDEGLPEETKIQVESEAPPPAEDNQPGFLSSLLSTLTFGLLGSSSSPVKGNPHGLQAIEPAVGSTESDGSELLYQEATYHLPETKGNYVAYRLPINEQVQVDDSTSSDESRVTGYSGDTQSTSFAWNGEAANLSAVSKEPEVHAEQAIGYQSLNPRGYQYGAPIKAFVEGPAATIGNSASPKTTGNGLGVDDTNILKPSDYASLSLSSVLPHRESVDFRSREPPSNRRISEDLAVKENVEEIPKVVEEKAAVESKIPIARAAEHALEVATTYSKIRSHGSTESSS